MFSAIIQRYVSRSGVAKLRGRRFDVHGWIQYNGP